MSDWKVMEVIDMTLRNPAAGPIFFDEDGAWRGMTTKQLNRWAEQLRDHYREKHGRGNYRVRVEKRYGTERPIRRLVALVRRASIKGE